MQTAREMKQADAYLRSENAKYTSSLKPVPRDQWPVGAASNLSAVMRSKEFLVQIFDASEGAVRLSICRTRLLRSGRWDDGISWDELQRLKREAGFESDWAVEIYPADAEIVNVANMRHLWVLPVAPAFAWKGKAAAP